MLIRKAHAPATDSEVEVFINRFTFRQTISLKSDSHDAPASLFAALVVVLKPRS